MKRLFLTASFADVADKFAKHYQTMGKRVAFIPTACDVEDYTAFMDNDRQAFLGLGLAVDELDLSAMSFDELTQKSMTVILCLWVGVIPFICCKNSNKQAWVRSSFKPSQTVSPILARPQEASSHRLTSLMWS